MRTKGCLLLLLSVVTASKHFYPDLSIVKGTSLRLGLAGKRVFYCRIFEVFFYVHLTKLFYTEKIQFMSVIRKKKLKPWESGISWLSADAYWILFFGRLPFIKCIEPFILCAYVLIILFQTLTFWQMKPV